MALLTASFSDRPPDPEPTAKSLKSLKSLSCAKSSANVLIRHVSPSWLSAWRL